MLGDLRHAPRTTKSAVAEFVQRVAPIVPGHITVNTVGPTPDYHRSLPTEIAVGTEATQLQVLET